MVFTKSFLRTATLSFIILVGILLSTNGYAQILTYSNATAGTLASVATNATGTSITRINGAIVPATACAIGFSATNFTPATTYSSTLPGIEVTATANAGYTLSVTSFSVDIRRSPTGPANVRYAYSINGGTTWINQGFDQIPNNASCDSMITATWAVSISVPSTATLMFAIYGFNASGTGGTFQVMNLIINGTVLPLTATCAIPTGLTATSITTTSALASWSAVSGAASYVLQYRKTGSTPWSRVATATTSTTVSGLSPATSYDYEVQSICSSTDSSGYTAVSTFTTLPTTPVCAIPTGLTATSITTTSALASWSVVSGAASYVLQYRKTGSTPWSRVATATTSTTVSGLTPATSYDYEVQSICSATDSSGYTAISTFTTLPTTTTGSTGKMTIYFNNPVNTAVSTGVNAVYLNNSFADTIVAYINRAKYSIDIAQYDYNQSSYANIATAVNNAYLAGKKVRWIHDGAAPNTGIALLNTGIHSLGSPTTSAYGIMHNKFIVIDANSTNPNDAIVNTGSEDWSITQLNQDYNNMLFIQDSALAHVYLAEFNMMWGDTGIAPNAATSKFGPFKTDLGRHTFTIGGKTVELYFSPSDGSDSHIQSSINSANTDLYFGVYDFTVSADANDIIARKTAGVYVKGIVDQYSATSSPAYPILTAGLTTSMITYTSASLIYHNKMMIVDPSNVCSDPQVETGSENWTSSGTNYNDENILIIHNDTVANIYYQSFYQNFTTLGSSLTAVTGCPSSVIEQAIPANTLQAYPNPTTGIVTLAYHLAVSEQVAITVYNMMGQQVSGIVSNEQQEQGDHHYEVLLQIPGLYFVRLQVGSNTYTQKIVKY